MQAHEPELRTPLVLRNKEWVSVLRVAPLWSPQRNVKLLTAEQKKRIVDGASTYLRRLHSGKISVGKHVIAIEGERYP